MLVMLNMFKFIQREVVKEVISSNQYEEICKRLITLETSLKGLILDMDNMRNKVLRRIQVRKDLEEEEEMPISTGNKPFNGLFG